MYDAILRTLALMLLCMAGTISPGWGNAFATDPPVRKPHVLFLISRDTHNYEADSTIPLFAAKLEKDLGCTTTVLVAAGERTAARFQQLADNLLRADLLVIFARRLALPPGQMKRIQHWFTEGKPLIGIRTANHAFSVAESDKTEGYTDWWGFVPEILGCRNNGYGPVAPGTAVSVVPQQTNHPILQGLPANWHSAGNLYLVTDTTEITPLLTGSAANTLQPIAWTRMAGKSRVFYTSLGHPEDFSNVPFTKLLTNAVGWALDLPIPSLP